MLVGRDEFSCGSNGLDCSITGGTEADATFDEGAALGCSGTVRRSCAPLEVGLVDTPGRIDGVRRSLDSSPAIRSCGIGNFGTSSENPGGVVLFSEAIELKYPAFAVTIEGESIPS